jgi:uncharacterized membrane protein YeaQ/YmgE (transglycosylase-associated protein family)
LDAEKYVGGDMGFLGWIILGLIVGAIVKALLPGRVGGGWVTSLVLGVVGAIVGGWIGDLLFGGGKMEFWNLGSWLLAIVGGLAAALIYGAITGRNKTTVRLACFFWTGIPAGPAGFLLGG